MRIAKRLYGIQKCEKAKYDYRFMTLLACFVKNEYVKGLFVFPIIYTIYNFKTIFGQNDQWNAPNIRNPDMLYNSDIILFFTIEYKVPWRS